MHRQVLNKVAILRQLSELTDAESLAPMRDDQSLTHTSSMTELLDDVEREDRERRYQAAKATIRVLLQAVEEEVAQNVGQIRSSRAVISRCQKRLAQLDVAKAAMQEGDFAPLIDALNQGNSTNPV